MAAALDDRSASAIVTLIVDTDSFEASYVASVLAHHEISVLGPFTDVECALVAVAQTPPHTAILGRQQSPEAHKRLTATLAAQNIPCLCLLQSSLVPAEMRNDAVLPKPFAGYQVAEWVMQHRR